MNRTSTGSASRLTGWGSVTSWSSWRSFTVTLLWSSGRVPLVNTPSLVITTGWRTLKSRAMADTSEGASVEGSDNVTISISASWPAPGTEGWAEITAQGKGKFITIPTCWPPIFGDEDRAIRGEGERSEKKADSAKATPFSTLRSWFLGPLSSKHASACECGLLITKEQFITQEINEKIKAVKWKQAFYFICVIHKFRCSLQNKDN